MQDNLTWRASMGKIALDWMEENNPDNPYVLKWLSSPFLPLIRKKLPFRGLLNHRDLKKEITESYAAYRYTKRIIRKLHQDNVDSVDSATGMSSRTGGELTSSPVSLNALEFDPQSGKNLVIFDLCSGKGFAALLFSFRFPEAQIYMIDKDKRMNVDHVSELPNVEMKYMDLVKDYKGVLAFMRRECEGKVGLVIGNHLCGDLSEMCVEFFNQTGRLRAMVLAPCCLSKRNKIVNETAAKLKMDNYDYWTLFLHQGVCRECSRNITRDEHVCSIKNNYILAMKPKTMSLSDVDLPPMSDRSKPANNKYKEKTSGNWKTRAARRRKEYETPTTSSPPTPVTSSSPAPVPNSSTSISETGSPRPPAPLVSIESEPPKGY